MKRTQFTPQLDSSGKVMVGQGEVVPSVDRSTERMERYTNWLQETLANPDPASIGASFSRIELLKHLDLVDQGVDAAASIQAANSLEKMLAHQMAVAHDVAMKLLYIALHSDLGPLNLPKLTNAAARLMETYQSGFLALHKIRNGGKQTVVVQHVEVSSGGNAVITGALTPRKVRKKKPEGGGGRF